MNQNFVLYFLNIMYKPHKLECFSHSSLFGYLYPHCVCSSAHVTVDDISQTLPILHLFRTIRWHMLSQSEKSHFYTTWTCLKIKKTGV